MRMDWRELQHLIVILFLCQASICQITQRGRNVKAIKPHGNQPIQIKIVSSRPRKHPKPSAVPDYRILRKNTNNLSDAESFTKVNHAPNDTVIDTKMVTTNMVTDKENKRELEEETNPQSKDFIRILKVMENSCVNKTENNANPLHKDGIVVHTINATDTKNNISKEDTFSIFTNADKKDSITHEHQQVKPTNATKDEGQNEFSISKINQNTKNKEIVSSNSIKDEESTVDIRKDKEIPVNVTVSFEKKKSEVNNLPKNSQRMFYEDNDEDIVTSTSYSDDNISHSERKSDISQNGGHISTGRRPVATALSPKYKRVKTPRVVVKHLPRSASLKLVTKPRSANVIKTFNPRNAKNIKTVKSSETVSPNKTGDNVGSSQIQKQNITQIINNNNINKTNDSNNDTTYVAFKMASKSTTDFDHDDNLVIAESNFDEIVDTYNEYKQIIPANLQNDQGWNAFQNYFDSSIPNSYYSTTPNFYSLSNPNYYSLTSLNNNPNDYNPISPNHYSLINPNYYSSTRPNSYSFTSPNSYSSTRPNSYSSTSPNYYSSTSPNYYRSTNPNYYRPSNLNSYSSSSPSSYDLRSPVSYGTRNPNYFGYIIPNYYTYSDPNSYEYPTNQLYEGYTTKKYNSYPNPRNILNMNPNGTKKQEMEAKSTNINNEENSKTYKDRRWRSWRNRQIYFNRPKGSRNGKPCKLEINDTMRDRVKINGVSIPILKSPCTWTVLGYGNYMNDKTMADINPYAN